MGERLRRLSASGVGGRPPPPPSAVAELGRRRSRKAAAPSAASAVIARSRKSSRSASRPCSSGSSAAIRTARLAPRTASPGIAASFAASASASASAVALGDHVDQAQPLRGLGVDELAEREQPQGSGGADPARQPLGAAGAGDQPEACLGEAELGPTIGDDQVAGEGELEPAAGSRAIDRGDHRHLDPPPGGEDRAGDADVVLHLGAVAQRLLQLVQVGAGRERLAAGTGEDDGADLAVGGDLGGGGRRALPGLPRRGR